MSRLILNIRYEICEPSGFIYEAASFAKKGGYILFLHPGKQQTLQAVEGLYDYWEALRVKTPAKIRADGIDVEKETMAIVKGNILLEESAPDVGRVFEVGYANKVSVEAVLTIVAVLRYNKDIGRYPEDLNKLIAKGYLKHLPVDPYSDKSLVYKKTDNDFVLYGFGLNFKDDGGKIFYTDKGRPIWRGTEEGGDMLFWPVPEAEVK